MPSFFKHSNTTARGVQKMHAYAHKQKPVFHVLNKPTHSHLNWIVPQASPVPAPVSSVFDTNDCIWFYGTVYVREAVAVEKIQGQQLQTQQMQEQHVEELKQHLQHIQEMHHMHHVQKQAQESLSHSLSQSLSQSHEDDDDTESTSGGSVNAFKCSRNIGKQNQIKYLKDGMRLRHLLLVDRATHEWSAAFDAETNRIIRAPDGVAFDTLRQFARLHSNEALSIDLTSTNVWSDPNFQYQDDASGQWHPLSDLKK